MRTWDIGPPEIVGSWNALPGLPDLKLQQLVMSLTALYEFKAHSISELRNQLGMMEIWYSIWST